MTELRAHPIIATVEESRRQFLAIVEHIRPELHRYCARMTGSAADGEDIVQDTLARAYFQLPELTELPPLRPWLFRIAHNRAIDFHRSSTRRAVEEIDEVAQVAADVAHEPDAILMRQQAVRVAVATFLTIAPVQRACVILKDVLEHSLDEIADQLSLSVPAVKAALHRGRERLRTVSDAAAPETPVRPVSVTLRRYSNMFNAHDWDGLRAMLSDDVKLDLVSRRKAEGRRDVGIYFTNYGRTIDWSVAPALIDGREGLVVYGQVSPTHPSYFVELEFSDDRVTVIRDFRYVPYIARESNFEVHLEQT